MREHAKKFLSSLTANRFSQRLLERLISAEQWLMGIGSGGVPETSGEGVVVSLLRSKAKKSNRPLSVFDVGANQGQFLSMLLRGLNGVPLRVHAFEPSSSAFQILNDAHRADTRLKLNHFGLGSRNGEMTLYSNEDASGIASLYDRRLDHFGLALSRTEKVTIDTLDEYCDREHVDSIDLLKLDVEGHELDVIRGGEKLFAKGAVDVVTFEFGGTNIDSRSFFQDFFYFFKQHKFDVFRITPSGYLAPVPEYREVYEQFRTTNFLARKGVV